MPVYCPMMHILECLGRKYGLGFDVSARFKKCGNFRGILISGSDLTLSIVQNNYGGPDSYSGPNYGKFMVGLQYMASK